jgi:hypothetical protein
LLFLLLFSESFSFDLTRANFLSGSAMGLMDYKPRTNLPQFRYGRTTMASGPAVLAEMSSEVTALPISTGPGTTALALPIRDTGMLESSKTAVSQIGKKVQELGEQVQSVSTALVGRSQELAMTGASWAAENPSLVIYSFLGHCFITFVTFAIVMVVGWYYRKVSNFWIVIWILFS